MITSRFLRPLALLVLPFALPAQQAPNPNDPATPHKPGIYLLQNGQMTLIPMTQASTKSGGGMRTVVTLGAAKTDGKISLEGQHAAVQITDRAPGFYFYFEQQQSGFGSPAAAPTSTDQFKLMHFEIKKHNREAVVMQVNGYGSSNSSPDKDALAFTATPVGSGFKVTPTVPLGPGEYCFVSKNSLVIVFPFGVAEKH